MFNKKMLVRYELDRNETASEGIDTDIQNLKKLSPKLAEKIKSLPDNALNRQKIAIGNTILRVINGEKEVELKFNLDDKFALPLQAVELTKFLDENFKDKKYQVLVSKLKKFIEKLYTKAAIDAKYENLPVGKKGLKLWEDVKDLVGMDTNKYELVRIDYFVDDEKIESILNTKEKVLDSFLPVKVGTYTYNGKENEIILKKMGTMGVIIELEGIKTEYKFNENEKISLESIKRNIDKIIKNYEKEEKAKKIEAWLKGISLNRKMIESMHLNLTDPGKLSEWMSYFPQPDPDKPYRFVELNIDKVDIDKNEITIEFDDTNFNEDFNKGLVLRGVINKDGSIDLNKFREQIKKALETAINQVDRYANGDKPISTSAR